jgi:hypothetical protein
MSRWLAAAAPALVAAITLACRQDPGIDIVRVPAQAYLPVDAGPVVEAKPDAAPEAAVFMLCVEAPRPNDGKPDDDDSTDEGDQPEMSSDFPDCPMKLDDRRLDPRVTQRHRAANEDQVCCYREKGSTPQPVRSSPGE